MKIQRLFVGSGLVIVGFAVSVGGCILGSDPNHNATLFLGGSTGNNGGIGGSPGADGGGVIPLVGTPLATFDTAADGTSGYTLDDFADMMQTNLNAAGSNAKPTVDFDDTDGSPTPGSLKIMAPYSGASQYVSLQKQLGSTALQDWTGGKLHVRIRVDPGSTFGGGVQMYVKTTTNYVFGGTFTNLGKGSAWQEFILNVDMPITKNMGYDPTKVISYGIELNTGTGGLGATPVTFHVDSFSLEGGHLPAADAGNDAAATTADSGTDVVATPPDAAAGN